jgi:hypothetical protein
LGQNGTSAPSLAKNARPFWVSRNARNPQGRDASRLDQPRQDRVGKRAGEMGNALGPIVAKAQMRLTHRLEVDRFRPAPGKARFRDVPGSTADSDQMAADQRVG